MAKNTLVINQGMGVFNERDLKKEINSVSSWRAEELTYSRIEIGDTNSTWELNFQNQHDFMNIPAKGTGRTIDRYKGIRAHSTNTRKMWR